MSQKSELFTRYYNCKSGLFAFTMKPGMSWGGKRQDKRNLVQAYLISFLA